jgi:hypothetical protein
LQLIHVKTTSEESRIFINNDVGAPPVIEQGGRRPNVGRANRPTRREFDRLLIRGSATCYEGFRLQHLASCL